MQPQLGAHGPKPPIATHAPTQRNGGVGLVARQTVHRLQTANALGAIPSDIIAKTTAHAPQATSIRYRVFAIQYPLSSHQHQQTPSTALGTHLHFSLKSWESSATGMHAPPHW